MSDDQNLNRRPGDDEEPGEPDPLAALFGGQVPPQMREMLESMGIGDLDPAMMQMVQAQVQAMMAQDDGSAVNASAATDTARAVVAREGDPSVGEATRRDVEQVVQVATLWLDEVTDFPPPTHGGPVATRRGR